MNSQLHFPNAEIMTKYLNEHALLKEEYLVQKGITEAIVELAVKRFASTECTASGIKLKTLTLVEDLKNGKDGFTGAALPNLGAIGLPQILWIQISLSINDALIDCAKDNAQ